MKQILAVIVLTLCTAFFTTCGLFDDEGDSGSGQNSIGGSTDIPMNKVGNKFKPGTFNVSGMSVSLNGSMEVIKSEKGVVTMKVTLDSANLSSVPLLKQLYDMVPDTMKDATGAINTQLKFKVTSEGVLDYVNMDGQPHALVKYSSNVGDTYSVKKSSGNTLTRTVTAKSTVDDFPYLFWNIKTMTIEQPMNVPGISKFVYRANHRFGIVYAKVEMEDGDTASTYVFSDSTGNDAELLR